MLGLKLDNDEFGLKLLAPVMRNVENNALFVEHDVVTKVAQEDADTGPGIVGDYRTVSKLWKFWGSAAGNHQIFSSVYFLLGVCATSILILNFHHG